MPLFEDSQEYMQYYFSNALVLKAMYDRGYDVSGVSCQGNPILRECIDIINGRSLEWPQVFPEFDEAYAEKLDEDTRYAYEEFIGREHYKIPVLLVELEEIWGRLADADKEQLGKTITEEVVLEEDFLIYGAPDAGVYKWEWFFEDGITKGIYLYLFDVDQNCCCEYPPDSTEVLGILKVLDLVKKLKKERLDCTSQAA